MNKVFKNIKRVLIANRGEIALRILHACKANGLEVVTIHSEPDEHSLAVRMSDFSVALGGRTAAESYLDIEKVVAAAKSAGADAIHPGYGFLSENPKFAEAVKAAGIVFIGPSSTAIANMGDKVIAKKIMQDNGVPVVPGSAGSIENVDDLKNLAKEIGYPVILKAAAGGGGRGMRIVREEGQLEESLHACQREAQSYFSNPDVFCEKYIDTPRHIEIQVLFDQHGNGVHLFERDCTIQRRHQKLIEEAPSQYLNPTQRAELGAIAIKAAKAVDYVGVGTVEFICESPEKAYFMEMNTRIQVEHPVTEMITGVDLITEQLKVADGHRLSMQQEDIKMNGWSIECRINAEDPSKNFMPMPGKITSLYLPRDPLVRVDTHIEEGYVIPEYYDSMIAKVICFADNREQAILRMRSALQQLRVIGVPTTAAIHENILCHPDFVSSDFSTKFIAENEKDLMGTLPVDQTSPDLKRLDVNQAIDLVTAMHHQSRQEQTLHDFDSSRKKWQEHSKKDAQRSTEV